MEFDKSKILTAITARQAKEGQKGWFGECEDEIVRNLECEPSSIKEINRSRAYAFRSESDFCLYPFFYPASEPTYAERQAEWLKDNNLKVGSTVKVVSIEHSHAKRNPSGKNRLIGTTNKIIEITDEHICIDWDMLPDRGCWFMSYLDLEPVNTTYRPFKNAEEFKPYRDEWFVMTFPDGSQSHFKVIDYNHIGIVSVGTYGTNGGSKLGFCTYGGLLKWATRENGEPCGVREDK